VYLLNKATMNLQLEINSKTAVSYQSKELYSKELY